MPVRKDRRIRISDPYEVPEDGRQPCSGRRLDAGPQGPEDAEVVIDTSDCTPEEGRQPRSGCRLDAGLHRSADAAEAVYVYLESKGYVR